MDTVLVGILDRLNKIFVIYTDDPGDDGEKKLARHDDDGVIGVCRSLGWVGHSLDPRSSRRLRMPVDRLVSLFASISGMLSCAKVFSLIQCNTNKNDPKAASAAVELMSACVVERAYTNFLSKDHGTKRLDVIPPILYNDLLALLHNHRTSDDPRSHAVTESVRASFARMLGLVGKDVMCIDMDGNLFSDPDGGKLDSLMRACRNLINARGLLASEFS